MNNTLLIIIEEWAGDNGININDKQINELAEAIKICSEVELGSRGFIIGNKSKSNEEKKIEELKSKLHTLEQYIYSKGLNISYNIGYVTEHTMESISDSHKASNNKTFYY